MITKTISILFFFIAIATKIICAQEIYFCERADSNGNPIKQSTFFKIDKDGGSLTCLLKTNDRLETPQLRYDIFLLKNGKEIFENTFVKILKTNYSWFATLINFKKAGSYVVYIYDGKDHLIKAGKVNLNL